MRLRTSFGRRPVVWRLVAGLSAAALLATLVSVNVLADAYKPIRVVVPPTISAGQNLNSLEFKVTNLNSPQTLGSLEIGLVTTPGFRFLHSGTNYGSVSDPDSTATVGFDPTTGMVVVQNLNLLTNDVATITLYGVQAPGCTALTWSVQAQQANQWSSGNNANYMTLSTDNPPLVSQPAETCALVFSTQPTDAAENKQITGTPLIPTAAPVTVQVVNTKVFPAQPVPAQTSITLSLNIGQLDYGYSSATLANPGPVSTNTTGAASFPGLSVNNPGRFTLTATSSSANIASANSSQFRIWDTSATCTGSGCSLPLSSGGEGFTVSSGSTTGALGGSVNIVPNFNCSATQFGGVPALPGTSAVLFTAPGSNASGNKTAEIFIPDATLQADVSTSSSTDNAINSLLETHYMPCMSAPHEFAVAWTPATGGGQAAKDSAMTTAMNDGQQWYRGLLPDCQDVANVVPCVQSRIYGNGGLTITVILSANDPMLF